MDTPVQQGSSNINPTSSVETTQPKSSRSILPIILIILGIIETIIVSWYLINLIVITPKLSQLYNEIGTKQPPNAYIGFILLTLFTMLAIAQIVYGFRLKKLNKEQGNLPAKHRKIAIIILVFVLLIVLLSIATLIYSVVLPIYNLTSNF